jgi:hypothetical protein
VSVLPGEFLYRTDAGDHYRLYVDEGLVHMRQEPGHSECLTPLDARQLAGLLDVLAEEADR